MMSAPSHRTDIRLKRAAPDDAGRIQAMLKESFAGLLETYQDYETSPATMTADAVRLRLEQPQTYYYFIIADGETVGGIRVVDFKDEQTRKRISPLFVLPAYRNRGIAQKAIARAEEMHGPAHWMLDTVLQEKGNCHLYEKMGYHQTGRTQVVNERMTLVYYEKD